MKVEELEEAIKFFEKKLPQEREMDQILKEVWEKADKNRLTTKTIRTMKSQKSASYSEQPIELNIAGDFKGFYEFLLQLERMPRLTRISQLSIEKMQNSEGQMEAKMTMSIFFEPEGGGLGGGATASVR
jgi:Tfp pilus assembly protein PilO